MNIDSRVEAILDMIDSLNTSTIRAGVKAFSYTELKKISAIELINLLATNKVRFVYKPEIKNNYE